jgi:hypothetical protein
MKTFTPVLLCLLVILYEPVSAQSMQASVINTSGGSYEGSGYTYEWSIGELALVNEMRDGDGAYVLTNGFLQPFPKKEVGQLPPAVLKKYEFRVLNNPVRDAVRFQLQTMEKGKLVLCLYDEKGYTKHYQEMNVSAGGLLETVNMMSCASANYVLKVTFIGDVSKEKKSQSYKLIKIH